MGLSVCKCTECNYLKVSFIFTMLQFLEQNNGFLPTFQLHNIDFQVLYLNLHMKFLFIHKIQQYNKSNHFKSMNPINKPTLYFIIEYKINKINTPFHQVCLFHFISTLCPHKNVEWYFYPVAGQLELTESKGKVLLPQYLNFFIRLFQTKLPQM